MELKEQTPLMAQYSEIRQCYPDALLLFQVGDFYELFFDDAIAAARFLGITLTKRGKANGVDIPLCGVPVHTLSHYLVKLVKGGFTVALCEQLSKPKPGTVVKRAVTRVYTPGTLTDTQLLDDKSASYLCTIVADKERGQSGLVFVELLTAHMAATTIASGNDRLLEAELGRFFPDEIVVPAGDSSELQETLRRLGYVVTPFRASANETLITADDLLSNSTADGWVRERFSPAVQARLAAESAVLGSVELLYRYLGRNQAAALEQLGTLSFYEPASYVHLDPATQKNLEVIKNSEGGSDHTLFAVVDRAQTAMGSRLLKKWLLRPLREQTAIALRHEVVEALVGRVSLQQRLQEQLRGIADIERMIGRIALGRAVLADYKVLHRSLLLLAPLRDTLSTLHAVPLIEQLLIRLAPFTDLIAFLGQSINDDDACDGLIKAGFSPRLDRLRQLAAQGEQEVQRLASSEGAAHGISSLKIGYTSVAGYFIEVTASHLHKVPTSYTQVQQLAGRTRYITAELKALEQEIAQAREDIGVVEKELFFQVEMHVRGYLSQLRHAAFAVATVDALAAFADLAYTQQYIRPVFNDEGILAIEKGRHPVVEVSVRGQFVANDTQLTKDRSLWLITGPNMGGKSTYLRQVALIQLLAQCGSFVPASRALLPVVDRIFTRIGAGDNLAQGKSTFLVEMEETATICEQATNQSLVILDEVGRGTSTEDGRALAQAIIEYLVDTVKAPTLFATHYHELTDLAKVDSRIENYHLTCLKKGEQLYFLHTLVSGVAQASFGIDVARLAHLPPVVIARARQLLAQQADQLLPQVRQAAQPLQIQLSPVQEEVLQLLQGADINELSPRAAFELLARLQQRLKR